MRFLAAAFVLISPAMAGAADAPAPRFGQPQTLQNWSAECPRNAMHFVFKPGEPLKPRNLAELPPANGYSAVYRLVDGCEAPIVVKYGVGQR